MRRIALRLAFFLWALVASPLVMWALFEAMIEIDDTGRAWLWILGIPALVTIAVGVFAHRSFWETVLAASLSASVGGLSVLIALFWACQGKSDCI